MLLLISFSFLAGLVTILSPCILPVLPVVLSASVDGDKKRPIGIVTGFVLGFSFFTLFLSSLAKLTGISADYLRIIAIFVLVFFGLSLLFPQLQMLIERLASGISGRVGYSKRKGSDFFGGILVGLSLGMVWTPCVGPILAAIITLAAASSISTGAVFIVIAYSLGTAIPMLMIMYGGRNLLNKVPWLTKNTARIQKLFGMTMLVTAVALMVNFDRTFQTFILTKFPQYGVGLTKFEDNKFVNKELDKLKNVDTSFYSEAPQIIVGGKWFNSSPLKLTSLKGKIVLVDFWTYSCINCIRTLPYIEKWYEKYKDKGFVVIGVHTPEFEFEKNPDNVAKAIKDFGLTYPIVQDNDYATWRAYNNRYWPAKYFIDMSGKIRSTHFGEGDYDQSEATIQQLLKEAGLLKSDMPISNSSYSVESQTPETYLGNARLGNLSSQIPVTVGKMEKYSANGRVGFNQFAYEGYWKINEENAEPSKGAALVYDYSAKNVFLVMGSKNRKSGQVSVYLDDKLIKTVKVEDYKLYEIVKSTSLGRHILKLEFMDSNLELYAFTFG